MSELTFPVVGRTVRNRREYADCSDGSQWTRRLDAAGNPAGEWTPVEKPVADAPEPDPPLQLSIIAEHQAPGEPKHWSLFCHRPDATGRGQGQVWQVTGDAEFMVYEHAAGIDKMSLDTFAWHQLVNADMTGAQRKTVEDIVHAEPPPSAVNRAAVTENCQGWVIRVLRRLVEEGIAQESIIPMLQRYMDDIRK
ncbi:hypothetical protein B0I35DRAFT_479580 [Stachybotrys elegans]|uniref:Uncharacterized protein n=1 Tax=Stachybotrys elegans TaxID=80388 RepID=A0A8K0SKF2_9HYPO|nr:hypothetical protein B0I35DRAFT_479580 [Stachybotrys elegans]